MPFHFATAGTKGEVIQYLESLAEPEVDALRGAVKAFIAAHVSAHDFPNGLSISGSGHHDPSAPTLSISIAPHTAQVADSAALPPAEQVA